MGRIPAVDAAEMTAEQKALSARVSGPRSGETRGPFPVWLRELAILINARHWSSEYQWHVHMCHARRLEIDAAALDAVAAGKPASFPASDEQAVYDFCRALLGPDPVSDDAHARAREQLGLDGVIELVTLVGFYSLIAVAIKEFDVGLPDGQAPYLART